MKLIELKDRVYKYGVICIFVFTYLCKRSLPLLGPLHTSALISALSVPLGGVLLPTCLLLHVVVRENCWEIVRLPVQ